MNVCVLDGRDAECDKFVHGLPRAKLCHTYAWSEMVQGAFGHKAFYLVARDDGSIAGVFPLIRVRSRLFGDRMVSQAFSNYGGPAATSQAALDALYAYAVEIANRYGCESIEVRGTEPLPYDLFSRDDKVTMHLELTSDPDELWRRLRPKVRNQVRKAKKVGIVAVSGGPELLDDFYGVWTVRMRQLGTPCYPRRLFRNIYETFPDDCRIFIVGLNGLAVGGAFVYSFNRLVQIRWAATLVEYNSLCPSNLLYWSVMRHSCLAGASTFDFGRCTVGSGSHRFKKQWGAEEVALCYQYWLRPGEKLELVRPDNRKYKRKVELWRRLPLWVTRLLGPVLSRSLP